MLLPDLPRHERGLPAPGFWRGGETGGACAG
jgi:hypothetical protein